MKVSELMEALKDLPQDVDIKIEYYYEWDGYYCEDILSDKIKMHKDGFVYFAGVINGDGSE